MAETDGIESREANCGAVLANHGLTLRKSRDGYQVVNASTGEAVAGPMSLDSVEFYAIMAVRGEGRPGGLAEAAQAAEMAENLPGDFALVVSEIPARRTVAVETMGPRAKTVIDTPTLRAGLLEKCEHLSSDGDFGWWISARPSRLLCGSCSEASQRADERRCAFCDGPADDPRRDTMVGMTVTNELGVYFYLCSHCVSLDHAAGGSL